MKLSNKENIVSEESMPEQIHGPAGEIKATEKKYSRTGLILQSVAFPGLGLSRLNGKPHWIKGVAGYGCIAGTVVFNKMEVGSYEEYGDADSPENANELFSSTKIQDNISLGFAYAAIAIWVTDLTWTFLGTSDLKNGILYGNHKGIYLDSDYDVISNTPLLSFKYKF